MGNDIVFSVRELSRGLSVETVVEVLARNKQVTQTLRPTLQLHPHHHLLDINV